jgi:uncharacterized repeat protein (TIGR01451 family)
VLASTCRRRLPGALLGVAFALVGVSAADAEVLRYDEVLDGGVTATGNTLGLSKKPGLNEQGTGDSIGTFISLGSGQDNLGVAPGGDEYPVGTTPDWTENGSSASLVLPAGTSVVYAELVWGGSYEYGPEDVTASLDSSVTLGSGADSVAVAPDPLTAVTVAQSTPFDVKYYSRSADVTDFVASHGAGAYSVEGVPATQASSIETANAAGWSLVVVYGGASQPNRSVSVMTGGEWVDETASLDLSFEGFCAPASGSTEGRVFASAIEGDANRIGDQLLAGPDEGSLSVLSGSNNPADNFFASQINSATGALDTSGTFGSRNHDAIGAANTVGGRQGWDLGVADLGEDELGNGQAELLVRAATVDDSYLPTTVAVQVGVEAPDFSTAAGVFSAASIANGEKATLTVTLDNTGGGVAAEDVEFQMPLPAGLGLESFAIDGAPGDAGGDPVTAGELTSGVDVGDVAAGAQRKVQIGLVAQSTGSFGLTPSWSYAYKECPSATVKTGSAVPSGSTLTVTAPGSPGPTGAGPSLPGPTPPRLERKSFRAFLPTGVLRADKSGRVALKLKSPVGIPIAVSIEIRPASGKAGKKALGRAMVSLAAQGSKVVRIRLSKGAREELANGKRIPVKIKATVTPSGGESVKLSSGATVVPPPPR